MCQNLKHFRHVGTSPAIKSSTAEKGLTVTDTPPRYFLLRNILQIDRLNGCSLTLLVVREMWKLLQSSKRTVSALLRRKPHLAYSCLSPVPIKCQLVPASSVHRATFLLHLVSISSREISTRALGDSSPEIVIQGQGQEGEKKEPTVEEDVGNKEYPSGEFEYEEFGTWKKLVVKFKMLTALPWNRVREGSVLTMKLRGQVPA